MITHSVMGNLEERNLEFTADMINYVEYMYIVQPLERFIIARGEMILFLFFHDICIL